MSGARAREIEGREGRRASPGRGLVRSLFVALVVLGALGAFGSSGMESARADTIRLVGGQEIADVTIQEAKWDVFTYQLAALSQKIEGTQVLSFERSGSRLNAAIGQIESGDHDAAEPVLARLAKSGQGQEKSEAAYWRGRCLLEWARQEPAKLPEAIAALEEYLAANQPEKAFYVPHATHDLGRALLLADRPANAAERFSALNEFGKGKGLWAARAKIGQAWVLLREKGAPAAFEARSAFGEVIADKTAPREAIREAALGRASACNVQQQHEEAIKVLDEHFFRVKHGSYDRSYAEASIIMAEACLGLGEPEEAELCFLRTTCFFQRYSDLYRHAAKSLAEIYRKAGNAERADFWAAKL